MKLSRNWLTVLVLAGTAGSVFAQRKIVETAPGALSTVTTNNVAPGARDELRGGNILDRLYRPNSIQLAPLDTAPSAGASVAPQLDPVVRKQLLLDRARRRNWAIENAAKINRGETGFERRRGDPSGRRAAVTSREPSSAELRLQAVDPKYAREAVERSGNASETALDRSIQKADRQRRQGDGRDSSDPRDPRDPRRNSGPDDPNADPDDLDPDGRAAGSVRRELGNEGNQDRWDKSLGAERGGEKLTLDGPLDGNAAWESGDSLDAARALRDDLIEARSETLRTERLQELSTLLGDSSSTSANQPRSEFSAGTIRAERDAEFQRLLTPESGSSLAPSISPVSANRLNGEPALATAEGGLNSAVTGFGSPGAAALQRDLPGLSAPGPALNFTPSASATFSPSTPRMTPRPFQLQIPERGKGGF